MTRTKDGGRGAKYKLRHYGRSQPLLVSWLGGGDDRPAGDGGGLRRGRGRGRGRRLRPVRGRLLRADRDAESNRLTPVGQTLPLIRNWQLRSIRRERQGKEEGLRLAAAGISSTCAQ